MFRKPPSTRWTEHYTTTMSNTFRKMNIKMLQIPTFPFYNCWLSTGSHFFWVSSWSPIARNPMGTSQPTASKTNFLTLNFRTDQELVKVILQVWRVVPYRIPWEIQMDHEENFSSIWVVLVHDLRWPRCHKKDSLVNQDKHVCVYMFDGVRWCWCRKTDPKHLLGWFGCRQKPLDFPKHRKAISDVCGNSSLSKHMWPDKISTYSWD